VTYGEFVVFILDSDHKLLEVNVQEQIAHLLEKQGRDYQYWMIDIFYNEEETLNDSSRNGGNGGMLRNNEKGFSQLSDGFVSKNAFISSLKKIGITLTNSEINRLVDRFDIYGNESCCVERFIRMVQTSRSWKHSLVVLAYQDQAIVEADYLRKQKRQQQRQGEDVSDDNAVSDELINMCEYLGICVLSEENMIWIASDALRAPLPVNWTAQKDSHGKTYFYNHLTNQSQWEHPLDPHFRNLRDKYRQR
jgi:hypothetical protein